MATPERRLTATLLSTTLVVTIVAAGTLFGAATPAIADKHTFEDAGDYTEAGNFTIAARSQSDHYPGDMNKENGSIEYHADLANIIYELGAENGTWANYIIISADWIDYTACSTENTVVFGIDRGGNNSGIKTDEDLIEHQEKVHFRPDGITINFLDWDDFAGDPPYFNPRDDKIVSAQGEGSNAGPCLTYTSEPGWYTMQGFMNGTEAKKGCTTEGDQNCEPPESHEEAGGYMETRPYFYICECDSEQEARNKLGPPPTEDDGETPTPSSATPTPTATPAPVDDTPTQTPEPDDGGGETTPTPGDGGEATPTATQAQNGGNGGGNTTPTVGSGPGFGTIIALIGLLGSALLLYRRP